MRDQLGLGLGLGRFFRIVWNWLQRDNEETRWTYEAEDHIETHLRLKRKRAQLKGW